MKRTLLFVVSAAVMIAQRIPGHYIVEFNTEPAATVAVTKKARFSAADADVGARKSQILAEHQAAESAIGGLGGIVTHHFTTIVNGMAVTLTEDAAAQLRQMPNVKGVYPVNRHHKLMDQAVKAHRIDQAWQTIPGGSANAGAGMKIAVLDCGVDATHPAFQGFSTAVPSGFPLVSSQSELANTNNKVIVSKVYSDLAGGIDNSQTDGSDYCVHGTSVAMIAAGLTTDPGAPALVASISGVAPGAWIGNYKIADDTGSSTDVTFLAGLEDALNDGMNVANYSYGGPVYDPTDENGVDARAIANAAAGGMLLVVSAGNSGPGIGTISSPAVTPGAIAVGAMENQRFFWFAAIAGTQSYYAVPPVTPNGSFEAVKGDVTGPLVDVTALDGNGLACNALPGASLTGRIALIQRGTCTFDIKLNNAHGAGAIGAIIFDNKSEVLYNYTIDGTSGSGATFAPSITSATLPAMFVDQADGLSLQEQIKANPAGMMVDLDFDAKTPLSYPSNIVADFSSGGPTPGGNVKPDIIAVGDWLVTAETTKYEGTGCVAPYSGAACYPPFTIVDGPATAGGYLDDGAGTSFSAPFVTGALATLMAARPGLTAAQYRSLIVNSAPEFDQYPNNAIAPPQLAGAGMLDLLGSFKAGLAASPSSLNFLTPATAGSGSGTSNVRASSIRAGGVVPTAMHKRDASASSGLSETLTVTNVGSAPDTFTVSINSLDGIATPVVDSSTFSLAAGASQTIALSIPGAGQLASGQYHGFVLVNGTRGQTPLRVPYWYGVAGTAVQNITILFAPQSVTAGTTDYIDIRCLDLVGLPFEPATTPTVTTASLGAQVVNVTSIGTLPGTFEAQIITGLADANGLNVFTVTSGSAILTVQITIK